MAETLGARIKKARLEKGWSQARLAKEMGVSRPAVTQWEADKTAPGSSNLRILAGILDVEYPWLAQGGELSGVRPMPVLGEVAAGVWREVNGAELDPIPVAPHPAYPPGAQYALIVNGPSINRIASHGDYIHVVDVNKAGLTPADDDIVVVERRRHGFVETSVKRLRKMQGRWALMPESDDPKYQEPLSYQGNDDATEICIIALAIGRYTSWAR